MVSVVVVYYSVASLFTMYVLLPGGEAGGVGEGTQTIAELASANCTFFTVIYGPYVHKYVLRRKPCSLCYFPRCNVFFPILVVVFLLLFICIYVHVVVRVSKVLV